MSSRRCLVTGSSGFLGRALISKLRAQGDRVFCIVRPGRDAPDHCIPIEVEAFDAPGLLNLRLPESCDFIVHLAAYGVNPSEREASTMYAVNVDATRALVELAAKHRIPRIVIAGSSAEYADHARPPFDVQQPLQAKRIYGASKAAATLVALSLSAHHGIDAAILRPYNIYGPGEAPHRLLPSLVRDLSRGQPVPLSPGLQIRDFIYLDDVVDAFVAAAKSDRPLAGAMIDVCTGKGSTVRAFAEAVALVMNADMSLLDFGALPMRPDDLLDIRGNPSAMQDILGIEARYGLDAGLCKALSEFRTFLPSQS